jgi:hypothetical protein
MPMVELSVKRQCNLVVVQLGLRVGPVEREIPFGFAQGRLLATPEKRLCSG